MPLVNHFLRRLSERYQRPRKVLGEQAWRFTATYDWPGDLRELENALERAFLFTSGRVIDEIRVTTAAVSQPSPNPSPPGRQSIQQLKKKAAMEVEVKLIREALVRFRGNVGDMASFLGITPRAVHMKLKTYGLYAASYRKGT